MVKNPLVSIIIPSYNHAKYIKKCLHSAISQTYSNFEIIVIDDGSSDGSHDLLTKLSRQHNFKYVHRENKGLIATLNEALELVNGTYFTMLGSDDYFEKDKLKLQVEYFKHNPEVALCYGELTYIDDKGTVKKKAKTKHYKNGMVFKKLLNSCFIPLPTVMLKTDVVKEFGGFDSRFFLEDYPLWLKITQKYPVGHINKNLTFYRLHNNNVSSNIVKMVKEVERILEDYNEDSSYKNAMSKNYLRWFADLSKTKYKDDTYQYMLKALPGSFYKPRFIRSALRYFLS